MLERVGAQEEPRDPQESGRQNWVRIQGPQEGQSRWDRALGKRDPREPWKWAEGPPGAHCGGVIAASLRKHPEAKGGAHTQRHEWELPHLLKCQTSDLRPHRHRVKDSKNVDLIVRSNRSYTACCLDGAWKKLKARLCDGPNSNFTVHKSKAQKNISKKENVSCTQKRQNSTILRILLNIYSVWKRSRKVIFIVRRKVDQVRLLQN